jgi:hypothetical protein
MGVYQIKPQLGFIDEYLAIAVKRLRQTCLFIRYRDPSLNMFFLGIQEGM